MNRAGRKRLNIDLPERIYELVQSYAQRKNITLTKYVIRALIKAIKDEK